MHMFNYKLCVKENKLGINLRGVYYMGEYIIGIATAKTSNLIYLQCISLYIIGMHMGDYLQYFSIYYRQCYIDTTILLA
jgi:hypothetical protein